MITINQRLHVPTLCDHPLAIGEVLRRQEARVEKQRRSFFRRAAKRVHRACIGRQTIESNLPLQ